MAGFDLPTSRNWRAPELEAFVQAQLLHPETSLKEVSKRCLGTMAYLATPYSKVALDDDGEWNATASLECGARAGYWARPLALSGVTAISPISQAVEMIHADFRCTRLDPMDAEFWENWCRPLLVASRSVIVPPIDGWDESEGIWHEVRAALMARKCVYLLRGFEDAELGA